ncbi:MAG: cobalamin-dependent protein, partial [Candidatus Methylomirabilis sp.]|nr:cobalamin-dependent protein [Deltaproteobacteria bacterium]
KAGYAAQVVNLGVERAVDPRFDLEAFIAAERPRLVGVSLHWHYQSWDALEAVRAVRRASPGTKILLGGFTASFFHREILETVPEVDMVVRGDGEAAAGALAAEMRGGAWDLGRVPNLTWRAPDGTVRENGVSYVGTGKDLDRLEFTRFPLIRHWEAYRDYVRVPWFLSTRLSPEWQKRHFLQPYALFFLPTLRGCPVACSYCGGGSDAQRRVSGRGGVSFRSPARNVDAMEEALSHGYEAVYIECPVTREDYFHDLFAEVRRRGVRIRCVLDVWGLPSERLVADFHETFIQDPGTDLLMSPECGSERVRTKNRGYNDTNQAWLDRIAYADRLGVGMSVFFVLGLPEETVADLYETQRFARLLQSRFRNVNRVISDSIKMEPASPMHLRPEEFGVAHEKLRFADFVVPPGGGASYFNERQGYTPIRLKEELEAHLGMPGATFDALIQEFKCRELCRLQNYGPFKVLPNAAARAACTALDAAWKADARVRQWLSG